MIAEIARANISALIDGFTAGTGLSQAAASHKLYGNSSFFEQFRGGKQSISVKKLDDLIAAFRANWPAASEWPRLRPMLMPDKAPVVPLGARGKVAPKIRVAAQKRKSVG